MGEGKAMATSKGSSSGREERRRRIVDRGSDRLALITGRIQDLSASSTSSTVSSPQFHSLNQPSSPSFLPHRDNPPSVLSNQINAGTASSLSAPISTLLKHESGDNVSKENDTGKQVDPLVHKNETKGKVIQPPAVDNSTESQPLPDTSKGGETSKDASKVEKTSKDTSNDKDKLTKQSRKGLHLLSCKQINSCIIASQGTRSFCSLIIALLVVLSYIDDALLGTNIISSEIVETLRPLYILLLTDVTIVLQKLFLEQQRYSEESEKEVEFKENGDNWTQAIQLMERGLVVYQIIRALFIDFSIYSVVVISCLLFV